MRAVWITLLIVVAFLVGGYVDYTTQWPFKYLGVQAVVANLAAPSPAITANGRASSSAAASNAPAPDISATPSTASTYVPHYSNDQGLQDAPRAEVMEGRDIDMKRCVTTLVMRRVPRDEAQGTCEQMFGNE
ncbi:MAG: hypothetical protein WDN49_04400 [Acetobacteraceae bacterium]